MDNRSTAFIYRANSDQLNSTDNHFSQNGQASHPAATSQGNSNDTDSQSLSHASQSISSHPAETTSNNQSADNTDDTQRRNLIADKFN